MIKIFSGQVIIYHSAVLLSDVLSANTANIST